jgi:hypothetical protein
VVPLKHSRYFNAVALIGPLAALGPSCNALPLVFALVLMPMTSALAECHCSHWPYYLRSWFSVPMTSPGQVPLPPHSIFYAWFLIATTSSWPVPLISYFIFLLLVLVPMLSLCEPALHSHWPCLHCSWFSYPMTSRVLRATASSLALSLLLFGSRTVTSHYCLALSLFFVFYGLHRASDLSW